MQHKLTYTDDVADFLDAWATGAQEDTNTPAHHQILTGISIGLLISAHAPGFAGRMLEQISESKDGFNELKNDVLLMIKMVGH